MWFSTASLTPAFLLGLGSFLGGVWPGLALVSITGVALVMDQLPAPPQQLSKFAKYLPPLIAVIYFAMIPMAVGGIIHTVDTLNSVILFIGYGLFFGQVCNANAHELIHQSDRDQKALGTLIYGTLLHGHHVSAHLNVHHRFAASSDDPSSARRDEGFYAFLWRAMPGAFIAGWKAERKRPHPYFSYAVMALIPLSLSFAIAGLKGICLWIALAYFAKIQLFLSDYVQHYGLVRNRRADGRLVPIGAAHSWNAPQWYSAALMLNAAHHSDHHTHPMQPFATLRITDGMPQLPYALPVMAVLALYPPHWKRVMNRRLDSLDDLRSGKPSLRLAT